MSDTTEQIMVVIRERFTYELEAIAEDAVIDIKQAISEPVERGDGFITRSAPGEPPRRDEGLLLDSEQSTPVESNGNSIVVRIGNTAPYSRVLEFGGPTNFGKIEARPYHKPAADEIAATIVERIGNAVSGNK